MSTGKAPASRWRPPDVWWARSEDGALGVQVMWPSGRTLYATFVWPPTWYWEAPACMACEVEEAAGDDYGRAHTCRTDR